MKTEKYKRYGFTIIELVVVIAIISILTAIIVPVMNGMRNRAKDAAIKSDMRIFFNLAGEYWESHGSGNFGGFCEDSATQKLYRSMPAFENVKKIECKSNSTEWSVCAQLNFPEDRSLAWCVDNSGDIRTIPSCRCATASLAQYQCTPPSDCP